MREIESGTWLVQFSAPITTQGGGTYNRNFDLIVVAPTLQEAISGVLEMHPEAKLHAVHRRGTNKVLFVVEPEGE